MTIAILPARLANQIAAGEVVERPASVIKELVENSLDAGATSINIEVDKGGVKRIRITDNGIGIVKDELTLALSRHATSKIKDLRDLEAINSLGFRGEALASISSVSRLTLTSKPNTQETAWQANAEGRDMAVTIKPAAHPDGTTIEVLDLFFNTPARRKFLRTDKTEFTHIDEVIRRIALARLDVNFSLTHNAKVIRQYRAATTKAQKAKRVAMVCGQKFVDNAIEVSCSHDNMVFSGWLAKPSFVRNQNDLSYSYVNGRMMRDKLINHAIRQAYADLLPPDTYPAFVLFLELDYREVDVNVHPAKHEVRFHQSRYVHDFIYSVCHKALTENTQSLDFNEKESASLAVEQQTITPQTVSFQAEQPIENVQYERPDYVKPLQQINEKSYRPNAATGAYSSTPSITKIAVENYQQLMTPVKNKNKGENKKQTNPIESSLLNQDTQLTHNFFVAIENENYGIFKQQGKLRLLSLSALALQVYTHKVSVSWQPSELKENKGLISQPLLLPIVLNLSDLHFNVAQTNQDNLARAGIVFTLNDGATNGVSNKRRVQIRQFPALLRDKDVNSAFTAIINELAACHHNDNLDDKLNDSLDDRNIISAVASVLVSQCYNDEQAQILWQSAKKELCNQKIESILLNSIALDLTSSIQQLKSITDH